MKLAIELNSNESEQLQVVAARLGVRVEELARAAVSDLLSSSGEDFEAAAAEVLRKNRELYERLS